MRAACNFAAMEELVRNTPESGYRIPVTQVTASEAQTAHAEKLVGWSIVLEDAPRPDAFGRSPSFSKNQKERGEESEIQVRE